MVHDFNIIRNRVWDRPLLSTVVRSVTDKSLGEMLTGENADDATVMLNH